MILVFDAAEKSMAELLEQLGSCTMKATVELPQAFSVRDDRELPLVQDLMTRLNPKLLVAQVATGVHIDGGYTVNWGLVYMEGQRLTDADVAAALKEAGLDAQHNAEIQEPRIWVNNEPGVTEASSA
jgi:hypothetical protein